MTVPGPGVSRRWATLHPRLLTCDASGVGRPSTRCRDGPTVATSAPPPTLQEVLRRAPALPHATTRASAGSEGVKKSRVLIRAGGAMVNSRWWSGARDATPPERSDPIPVRAPAGALDPAPLPGCTDLSVPDQGVSRRWATLHPRLLTCTPPACRPFISSHPLRMTGDVRRARSRHAERGGRGGCERSNSKCANHQRRPRCSHCSLITSASSSLTS